MGIKACGNEEKGALNNVKKKKEKYIKGISELIVSLEMIVNIS